MARNFNLEVPSVAALKEPAMLMRGGLGLLVLANLIAALFAFHVFGTSPAELDQRLTLARSSLAASQGRLGGSRTLTKKVDTGRTESETFLATYASDRRHTYSTIIAEINTASKLAGMNMKEESLAPLDPIEGSDDLDIMTISVNFEGGYTQLVHLVNLLDRSPRFLIIESMQAAPQAKGDTLTVTLKLNALVRGDTGSTL